MKDCLIQIPLNAPLDYHMSGKFEAPSDDWMHEDFDLTDFELIIMTENVLYIEYIILLLLYIKMNICFSHHLLHQVTGAKV